MLSSQAQRRFMLLFRGTDWYQGISPEQMQQIIDDWMVWFKRLQDQGSALAGSPLEHTGKTISGPDGRVISDGPFVESKETVGGYFMIRAGSLDEAVAISKDCPGLPYGICVEVRPVADACPFETEVRIAHP